MEVGIFDNDPWWWRQFGFWMLFPGEHAASICDNTPEAICRVLEEEEEDVT
jgi:hypothetical protein